MEPEDTHGASELEATLQTVAAERDGLTVRMAELEGLVQAGETRWRDSVRAGALALALQQAGCRDVDAALRLLDTDYVTVADDGTVQGVTEAVDGLKRARAYLFTPRSLGGTTNPAGGAPGDPAAAFAEWLRNG